MIFNVKYHRNQKLRTVNTIIRSKKNRNMNDNNQPDTKRQKKILISTILPSPYRVDFFRYLQDNYNKEYEIHILFLTSNENSNRQWSADENRLHNIHFLKSKVIKLNTKFDEIQKIFNYGVTSFLNELKPDAVVGVEYNPTTIMIKHWCNKHKTPYISWSDGTAYSERNIGLLQKLSRRYIIRNSAAFIASSTKTRENQILLGADDRKIYISELSIDLNNYADPTPDKIPNNNLIFVGTLIERKGLDLLLDALKLITDTDWTLIVAGDGHDKDKLVSYVKELSLEDRVLFKGFVAGKDLTALYESSSIFILPTREDCFGLVILEAMCCSLPVISSKYADGAHDLIEEGVNGYIIDPYDPLSFSEKIKKLLTDKELCHKMGKRSKEKTKEFDFSITGKAYMDAINSVLQQGLQ